MTRDLPPPITLTEAAKARIIASTSGKPGVVGLRVGIKNTGCSGMSYTFALAEKIEPTDLVIDLGETSLLIDGKAEMFLIGARLDYVEGKLRSGFEFHNPNEQARCGCGESFTPKHQP